MNRLGVYRIRLQKNKISKHSRYRSLRWAVIEGEGDGRGHSIYSRTLINQTLGLSADLRPKRMPKQFKNNFQTTLEIVKISPKNTPQLTPTQPTPPHPNK